MACDVRLKPRQTISERAKEVREALQRLAKGLINESIKPVLSRQGGITFAGWADVSRDGLTDACAYRLVMSMGDALARAKIERAEFLAGVKVDRKVLASGHHSHDGGKTWHHH